MNKIKILLSNLTLFMLVLCAFFVYRAFNVKYIYDNGDYSKTSKNVYVGGDAYNYIINANYFTGYCVGAGSCMIVASILYGTQVVVVSNEQNRQALVKSNNDIEESESV